MSTRLLDLLEPKAIKLQYRARDRIDVITQLGKLLYDCGYVRESFVEAALDRERELPTGLPLDGQYNAAIPHTDVQHVIKPALALATLSEPVIFQNMVQPEQDVPVQLVILMALDQPKSQVEMLQEIASVLQNPETIGKLMNATTIEGIQRALE